MYNSLKSWATIPITIRPCIKRTGTGSKVFGDDIQTVCYPECEVKVVRNVYGAEVTSNRQLYVDGSVAVGTSDELIFEGERVTIHAISTFYRNGKPDLKVVYV